MPKRLSPHDRKAQLLNYAFQAFAAQGVERAGHGDIAKLAGVSTATVFNYFPTRDDLCLAVFQAIETKIIDMLRSVPDRPMQCAADHVRLMAGIFGHLIDAEPDVLKVFLNWSVSFGDDVRPLYLRLQDLIIIDISKRFTDIETDKTNARILYATAMTYAVMKLDKADEVVLERYVDRVAYAFNT